MKKSLTFIALVFAGFSALFGQTTPFSCSATNPAYVIGFKNGSPCTVAPYSVYTMTLTGTISSTPLFTTPDTIEVNGIGINPTDSRGYGLWYRRIDNSIPNSCINDTIKLIRFGANGVVQLLGYIPQPSGYTLNTALGTIGADGAYYYGALINGQLSVGRIANVAGLSGGTGPLTATYRTIVNNCSGRSFGDWAFRPSAPNVLYTYGISVNASNQVTGVVMTIDLSAPTINAALNCQSATETTGTFFDAAQDNIVGIMFGADGNMYGVNTNTRRYYRINPTTGAVTLISTIPANGAGTPTTAPLRGDLGSCYVSILPIVFSGFTVSNGSSCSALLNWKISGAEAGDRFAIEKSYDGTQFFTLAVQKAEPAMSDYTLTDPRPGPITFYRINAISKDGSNRYSSLFKYASGCNGKSEVVLFNNLLSGSAALTGQLSLFKTGQVAFTVYNTASSKVFSRSTITGAGVSTFNYPVNLTKGVYLLQVMIGEEKSLHKFVVQ